MLAVEQRGSRVEAAGAPGGWGVSKACRDCAGWRERLAEAQRSLSGALADAKVWRYWHGKAKERAAWWQAQYEGKCAERQRGSWRKREVGKQRRRIADLERAGGGAGAGESGCGAAQPGLAEEAVRDTE